MIHHDDFSISDDGWITLHNPGDGNSVNHCDTYVWAGDVIKIECDWTATVIQVQVLRGPVPSWFHIDYADDILGMYQAQDRDGLMQLVSRCRRNLL